MLAACASTLPPPPASWDGLEFHETDAVGALYLRPGRRVTTYRTVVIDPLVIATDPKWYPIRDIRTGLEYWYRDRFAVRAGANGKDLAFGAGVRHRQFGADYALSLHRFFAADDPQFPDDSSFDPTQMVSVGWSW